MAQKKSREVKTPRLDETPESRVLVGEPVDRKVEIAKSKAKMGRPSSYTEDKAAEICGRIALGESLRSVLRDDNMPDGKTVFKWMNDYPNFLQQYTRAKEESADALADDIQDIATRTLKGEYDPQASRVAIDAYKWTASKLKPKKYGDKLDVTSDGERLPTPLLGSLSIPAQIDENNS